jgi:hypothetical protein
LPRNSGPGRHRHLDVEAHARARAASTAGLYTLDASTGWRGAGAGVCFRVGGRAFVLSTGRVLAPDGPPVWLASRRLIVPLAGAAVLGDGGPDAPPELATLDAAFGFIAPDDAQTVAHDLEFVSLADIDVADGDGGDRYLAVSAIPSADADRPARPVSVEPVLLQPAASTDYQRCRVGSATHLVLRPAVDSNDAWSPDGLRGCGVWRVSGRTARAPLAGIVIGGVGGARPCVVATRPAFAVLGILGFLGAGLPEVAPGHRPH